MPRQKVHPAMIRATDLLKKRLLQYEEAQKAVVRGKSRREARLAYRAKCLKHAIAEWVMAGATEPQPSLDEGDTLDNRSPM